MNNRLTTSAGSIALYDFLPAYCPNCGKEIKMHRDSCAEYWQGVSQQCLNCSMAYQYTPRKAMLETAKTTGDLAQFRD